MGYGAISVNEIGDDNQEKSEEDGLLPRRPGRDKNGSELRPSKRTAVFTDSNSDLSKLEQLKHSRMNGNFAEYLIQQITAVFLVCMLNFMLSIPFGVSYFPVEWRNLGDTEDSGNVGNGGGKSIKYFLTVFKSMFYK